MARENNDLFPTVIIIDALDHQDMQQQNVNGLLGQVNSIFHFLKMKLSFGKSKNNDKNTQYLIK